MIIDFKEKALLSIREMLIRFLQERSMVNNCNYESEIKLIDNSKTVEEIKEHVFYFYKIGRINNDEYYYLNASIDITV